MVYDFLYKMLEVAIIKHLKKKKNKLTIKHTHTHTHTITLFHQGQTHYLTQSTTTKGPKFCCSRVGL